MLQQRKIKNFAFVFKHESVVMKYNDQFIAFHAHTIRNKKPLALFAEEVARSRRMDLNTVFGLARRHNIPAMHVSREAFIPDNPRANIRRIM